MPAGAPEPLPTAAGLAYRAAGPPGGRPVLCVHGWPESSYMWRRTLEVLGGRGLRAVAPDLPGFGASPHRRPATWAMHRAALEDFRTALGMDRAALVVHDWGGLIGLRWACEHPGAVDALVVSATGFFPDGRWHGMARALRTPGDGERLVDSLTRQAFDALLLGASTGIDAAALDEYWRGVEGEGRAAVLELYRSGNLEELAPYEGALAALGVPTLLLWGEDDPFAPVAGARRFEREIPHAELHVIPGTGHFVVDDAPLEYAERAAAFLAEARSGRP